MYVAVSKVWKRPPNLSTIFDIEKEKQTVFPPNLCHGNILKKSIFFQNVETLETSEKDQNYHYLKIK